MIEHIKAMSGKKILVVGDAMLDVYLSGTIRDQLSFMPIVEICNRWCAPGGAANAAANITALGGEAVIRTVVGCDDSANDLIHAMRAKGVQLSLSTDGRNVTTTKTRLLAGNRHIARYDTDCKAVSDDCIRQIIATLPHLIQKADAVLISDYGKGVVRGVVAREIINLASQHSKPVIVDPKGNSADKYLGCAIIKPNLSELMELTGNFTMDWFRAGEKLAHHMAGTAVVVTRGHDGMTVFLRDDAVEIRAVDTDVIDEIGAGDSVAAALALAISAGATVHEAAQIANAAGSIAVSKLGTATVTQQELFEIFN